jgi:hypothetical protein
MTSPYLEQSLVPLCVTLRQMLENVEAELANAKLRPPEQERLRRRAQLIRSLLTPSRIT